MEHLVVIGPGNIIRGYIGDVHLASRKILLRANKLQQTAAHESNPGAGDVTFVSVTDPDDAAFQLREISVGFAWDVDNKRGIPNQGALDARVAAVAAADDKRDVSAAVGSLTDIVGGSLDGAQAVQVIARAVRFLVVRALREGT